MPSPRPAPSPNSAVALRGWRRFQARFLAQSARARTLEAAILALLIVAGGLAIWARRENPLLTTPVLALRDLQATTLYYNGLAWPWLRARRPDLLRAEDQDAESLRVRGFTQAVQNPKLFRQLDRQERFDKLLFVGDPSQYRPLLEHLLETRDWTLTYVDHTSLIFQRGGANPWQVSQVDTVMAKLGSLSARDRAVFLALTAGKLVALHEWATARALLDRARTLSEKVPEIWSVQAQYHLGRGEWKESEAAANRALELDPANLSAMGTKAQVLYSTRRFNEAYAISRQLVDRLPDDPSMLFYHAKIAHEAHAYSEEERVLRTLIELAEKNDRPASSYRVYLGQSLASVGEAAEALKQFGLAQADPDLPKEQRAFAEDCVKVIRSPGGAVK